MTRAFLCSRRRRHKRAASVSGARRCVLFFQAKDDIRDSVASRGLGDMYKRQVGETANSSSSSLWRTIWPFKRSERIARMLESRPLYTSDAADDMQGLDLRGPRFISNTNLPLPTHTIV